MKRSWRPIGLYDNTSVTNHNAQASDFCVRQHSCCSHQLKYSDRLHTVPLCFRGRANDQSSLRSRC